MKKWIFICAVFLLASCSRSHEVVILTGKHPSPTIQFAAGELAGLLGEIYPGTQFTIKAGERDRGRTIRLSTEVSSEPWISPLPQQISGAYSVSNNGNRACIYAYDDPGVLQGVYKLLEKLGYDFHLSQVIIPQAKGKFSFEAWDLSDYPMQEERIVFNWHNFLSGCSGWDLEQWKEWILHSARLGFNTIMIHTYGNNPIHSFSHRGVEKASGYLATSVSGRDWGTEHVNNVRRLIGGELFEDSIFGSQAALVQDTMREEAARSLMQEVFEYAQLVGMKINFAFDMDTRSANPQEILSSLPAHALIKTADGFSLANPETEEGYAFYRSQIMALLNDYPQIDRLVAWTRKYNPNPTWLTPVRSLRPEQFPESWDLEYMAMIEKAADMEVDPHGASSFVIGKILLAYEQIIAETGSQVELGSGSWEFKFLPAAHYFYPENVALYPLDFKIRFHKDTVRKELYSFGKNRRLIPIVWAHHDDHRYMGKPYTPFDSFQEKLEEAGSSGFGVIHWLTRPLDLYFKSLSRQTWESTSHENLTSLSQYMSGKIFPGGNELFEEYLIKWVLDAPMFGRETSDYFMDPGTFIVGEFPTSPDTLIQRINMRISLLKELLSETINPGAKKQLEFYLDQENFYHSFIHQQNILYRSNKAWMNKQYKEATELIQKASPEESIEAFSSTFQNLSPTRGELAMIISLNLRWYPDFINQKQLARLEPLRYNFQPTLHDSLAQAPGTYTFFVDQDGTYWRGYGEKEIGNVRAASINSTNESSRDQYIISDDPFTINLQTWRGQPLSPGKYRLAIHTREALPERISVQLTGQGQVKHQFIPNPEKPGLELEFVSPGGPLQLILNPAGKEIKLSSLEIIPLQ